MKLSKEKANKIYDILVNHGGAIERYRTMFVGCHEDDNCNEFRFQGLFGFGGKYWSCENRISYYSEDKNTEREELKNKINNLIKEV